MGRGTSLVNQRNWRRKPTWQCRYSLKCKRARGSRFYCPEHLKSVADGHRRVRHLRRRLGFCIYCLARVVPGYTKCQRHLTLQIGYQQKWRDKGKTKRGWKLARVPA